MGIFGSRRKKLARAENDYERIAQLIALHGASAVIDVGANTGQYARRLRAAGLLIPIVSVEPGSKAYTELVTAAAKDPTWTVAPRMALGDASGTAQLNINERSDMSSLRPMTETTHTAFPKAKPTGTEEVRTERLDGIFDELMGPLGKSVFLKIDTQGYEAEVIRGAAGVLDRIMGIQLEMSLVPLYEGEPSYLDILSELDRLGYDLHLVISGFFSRTFGRQLQFDGVLFRQSIARRDG